MTDAGEMAGGSGDSSAPGCNVARSGVSRYRALMIRQTCRDVSNRGVRDGGGGGGSGGDVGAETLALALVLALALENYRETGSQQRQARRIYVKQSCRAHFRVGGGAEGVAGCGCHLALQHHLGRDDVLGSPRP